MRDEFDSSLSSPRDHELQSDAQETKISVTVLVQRDKSWGYPYIPYLSTETTLHSNFLFLQYYRGEGRQIRGTKYILDFTRKIQRILAVHRY